MRRHPSREARPIADPLNHAGDVRSAIQHAHLARDADVGVDDGLVVRDHVLGVVGGGALERVRGPAEEVAPERRRDELQEGEDARWALSWGGWEPVEEEVEEAEAEGVALLREAGA